MAGDAFVQAPLTNDFTALREVLAQSGPKAVSLGGTNIPAAIKVAARALESSGVTNKAVVLVSDGENLEGRDVEETAQAHGKQRITFFTVGVGTAEGGPVFNRQPGPGFKGTLKETVRDEYGLPVRSRLDERNLRSIASAGGGRYFHFEGMETWNSLYKEGLKPLAHRSDIFNPKDYYELFQIPLLLAFILLTLEAGLSSRLKNPLRPKSAVVLPERGEAPPATRIESGIPPAKQRAVLPFILLPLLVINAARTEAAFSAASPVTAQAEQLVNEGKAGKAAELLRAAAQTSPDDYDLLYNYAIAAYAAGDFTGAVDAFSQVAGSPDASLRARALAQMGNAQYRLGDTVLKIKNEEGAVLAWEKSVEYYLASIQEKGGKMPKYNLEIVRKKLEELLVAIGNQALDRAAKAGALPARINALNNAFEKFQKALQLNPDNKEAAEKLEATRKLLSENLQQQARELRDKAAQIDPKKSKPGEKERMNVQAGETYERATEIDPHNTGLAQEYADFKNAVANDFADAAEARINEALKIPETQGTREALLVSRQNLLSNAVAQTEKALSFDENNARAQALKNKALKELEKSLVEHGDLASGKAEATAASAKNTNPESAANQFQNALEDYQKALDINPENGYAQKRFEQTQTKLAEQLTKLGKSELAKGSAEGNQAEKTTPPGKPGITRAPKAGANPPANAQLRQQISHLEKAEQSFTQANALSPGKNDAAALQLEASGKLNNLRSSLDQALNNQSSPSNSAEPSVEDSNGETGRENGDGPSFQNKGGPPPPLSFSETRINAQGEPQFKEQKKGQKIRDW